MIHFGETVPSGIRFTANFQISMHRDTPARLLGS